MASIQQSMNQLLGAVAGASTMGAYMVRGSNWYKAGQAEKSAKTIEKTLNASEEELAKMTPAQREAHLKRQQLATEKRAEAGTLYPTEERAKGISASYQQLEEKKGMLERVKEKERGALAEEAEAQFRAQEEAQLAEDIESGRLIIGEDGSQTEITETQRPAPKPEPKPAPPTKEELELQRAQETVRRYIMGQDRIGTQQEQTLRYQQALQLIREQEGLN